MHIRPMNAAQTVFDQKIVVLFQIHPTLHLENGFLCLQFQRALNKRLFSVVNSSLECLCSSGQFWFVP